MLEEWRPIVEFQGDYEVSNLGRVRSVDRRVFDSRLGEVNKRGKIIASNIDERGYPRVGISAAGKKIKRRIHRLMADAFLGFRAGDTVNHIDGDKTNNCLSNLEIVSALENHRLAVEAGRLAKKLDMEKAETIRFYHAQGMSKQALATLFGVSAVMIGCIVRGKCWKTGGPVSTGEGPLRHGGGIQTQN